jgi:type II secretory pathway pseudopilin PulG
MFAMFRNEKGFGLIAAIFVIVILAMFGLLVARYTTTSSVSSVEDYLWAQALYSAESAAQLQILNYDGGGNWVTFAFPTIADFTITPVADDFDSAGTAATLSVRANRNEISREIEVKYIL